MSSLNIRPRFRQIIDTPPESAKQILQASLNHANAPCKGLLVSDTATISILPEEQHYWSPQLNLSFEKYDENKTLIRGFYGPKPSIWSIFTLGYSAIGILSLFILIYGTSQWMLKKDPFALWFLPVLAILALGMYIIAQFGQKFGAQQMFTLHQFYEKVYGVRLEL